MPHICSSYISTKDIGDLRLPPLEHKPGKFPSNNFSKEINEAGVYIHKMNTASRALAHQFDKIQQRNKPTPSTLVAVGPYRTYNEHVWEGTSGIIFSPSTVSLVSFKSDIFSNRLASAPGRKTFTDFSQGTEDERLLQYAKHISDQFDGFGPWGSANNNRSPKKFRLIEDVTYRKAKSEEVELRSNLAFRKINDAAPGKVEDIPSKFFIVKKLKETGKPLTLWTKSSLLSWLNEQSVSDEAIAKVLSHAIKKIERFRDDDAVQRYLQRGNGNITKAGYYTSNIKNWGVQTPNEHLLLPKLEDVIGICLNVESIKGIDEALQINRELRERTINSRSIKRNVPPIIHIVTQKLGSSLVRVGWSEHVIPWSSEGLKAYAKAGQTHNILGVTVPVDHFKLIDVLSHAGNLTRLATKMTINGIKLPNNLTDDLSGIKELGSNLLHLAIENGRDLDCIKFFYFWKVNAFSERNLSGKTALDLAREMNHSGYAFLKEAEGWQGDEKKISIERNAYVSERLRKHPNPEKRYALRNGVIEEGHTTYIPELGTRRVTDGKFWIDSYPNDVYDGIRKYDESLDDLALTIGTCVNENRLTQGGLWAIRDPEKTLQQNLHVGSQYWNVQPGSTSNPSLPECFGVISKVNDCHAAIRVHLLEETARFGICDVEASLSSPLPYRRISNDSSSYFKAKFYIPLEALDAFRTGYMFSHLPITGKNIDTKSLSGSDRNLVLCKLLLAQIHYISAWKNSFDGLSLEEREYILSKNRDFFEETELAFCEKIKELRLLLESHSLALAIEIRKVDKNGRSLLGELGKIFIKSTDQEDVKVQISLGKSCESIAPPSFINLNLARQLYEKALCHQSGEAASALARFYKQGIGGVLKDHDKGLEFDAMAKTYGFVPAPATLSTSPPSIHPFTLSPIAASVDTKSVSVDTKSVSVDTKSVSVDTNVTIAPATALQTRGGFFKKLIKKTSRLFKRT